MSPISKATRAAVQRAGPSPFITSTASGLRAFVYPGIVRIPQVSLCLLYLPCLRQQEVCVRERHATSSYGRALRKQHLPSNSIFDTYFFCAAVKFGAVVAVDAVERALGTWAGSLTAILVALSTLGSANATIMCGGRYLVRPAVPSTSLCRKPRSDGCEPVRLLFKSWYICGFFMHFVFGFL